MNEKKKNEMQRTEREEKASQHGERRESPEVQNTSSGQPSQKNEGSTQGGKGVGNEREVSDETPRMSVEASSRVTDIDTSSTKKGGDDEDVNPQLPNSEDALKAKKRMADANADASQ